VVFIFRKNTGFKMSHIIPFQFNTTSIRVITTDDGETLFVAKDIAEALGYANTASAITNHCKKAKATHEYKVSYTHTLHPQTKLIPESDVYRLAMKSELPTAEPFQDWLADEVIPTIRKTGGYQAKQNKSLPPMNEAAQAAVIFADYLRLPESGKLLLLNTVNESYGSPMLLPSYGVDSPPSEMRGNSSMPVASATELLSEHGVELSTIVFNKLLVEHGIIEMLTRKSTGKKTKNYKSVTKLGLEYGKNDTSPSNSKETQPHWYIHKFRELLDLVFIHSVVD